jgi:hypothetical protein
MEILIKRKIKIALWQDYTLELASCQAGFSNSWLPIIAKPFTILFGTAQAHVNKPRI